MKTFKIWLDENFDILQRDPAGLKAMNSNVDQFEVQSLSQLGHEIVFASDVFVKDIKYSMTFDRQATIDGVVNYFYVFELKEAQLPIEDTDYKMTVQINARDGDIDETVQSTVPIPYKVLHQSNGSIVYIPVDELAGVNNRLTSIEVNKYDKPRALANVETSIGDGEFVTILTGDGQERVVTFATLKALIEATGITATFATRTDLFTTYPPANNDPNDPDNNYANFKMFVIDSEGEGSDSKVWEWNGTTWYNTEQSSEVSRIEFDALKSVVDSNVLRLNNNDVKQGDQDVIIEANRQRSVDNATQINTNTNKNAEQDTAITEVKATADQNKVDITEINDQKLPLKQDVSNMDTENLSTSATRYPSSKVVTDVAAGKMDALQINGSAYQSMSNVPGSQNPSNTADFIFDDSGTGGGTGTVVNVAQATTDYTLVEDAAAIPLTYPTLLDNESSDPSILLWEFSEDAQGNKTYTGIAALGSSDTLYKVNVRGEVQKGGQQDAELFIRVMNADTNQIIGQEWNQSIDADNDSSTYNATFNITTDNNVSRIRIEARAAGNDLNIASATSNQVEVSTTGQTAGTMLKAIYDQDANNRVDNADFKSYDLTVNYADTDNTNAALLRTDNLFGDFTKTEDRNGDPYASVTEGLNMTRADMGSVNSLIGGTNLSTAVNLNYTTSQSNSGLISQIVAELTQPQIPLTKLIDSKFTRNQEQVTGEWNVLFTSYIGTSKMEVTPRDKYTPSFERTINTTYTVIASGQADYTPVFNTLIGDNPAYMEVGDNGIGVMTEVPKEYIEVVGFIETFENAAAGRFELHLYLNGNSISSKPINGTGDIEVETNNQALQIGDVLSTRIVDTQPNTDSARIVFKAGFTLFTQNGNHRGVIVTKVEALEWNEFMANVDDNSISKYTPYHTPTAFSTNEMSALVNENWTNDNVNDRYSNMKIISAVATNIPTDPFSWMFVGTFEIEDTYLLDEYGDPTIEEVVGRLEYSAQNQNYTFKFNGQVRPEPLDLRYLGITANGTQVATEFEKWFGGETNRNGFGFNLDTIVGEYIAKIRVWDGGETYHTNGNLENNSLSADIGESKGRLEITNGSTTILTPLQSRLSGADPIQDQDFATKRYVDTEIGNISTQPIIIDGSNGTMDWTTIPKGYYLMYVIPKTTPTTDRTISMSWENGVRTSGGGTSANTSTVTFAVIDASPSSEGTSVSEPMQISVGVDRVSCVFHYMGTTSLTSNILYRMNCDIDYNNSLDTDFYYILEERTQYSNIINTLMKENKIKKA